MMARQGIFWKPTASNLQADSQESELLPLFPTNSSRVPLFQQRLLLPIFAHKKQILFAIEHYQVVVIVGETGSGKSTQIPQFAVESGGWAAQDFALVCTQPRRIAAITLARRVAEEAGVPLGQQVGYTVRFEDQTGPLTQIKYVTDGILLREATLYDPLLSNYSVVMVDEAHERNLNSDAVLGLLKKIQRQRKDLRLVVCSATIDAEAFLEFFTRGGNRPSQHGRNGSASTQEDRIRGTIISVDGRQHPVDVLYLEEPTPNYIQCLVDTCWRIHRQEKKGDILCFLPSGEDIDRAVGMAQEQFPQEERVELLPLYGTLPYQMQMRVFDHPTADGYRRVVFATNMAETSVTVPSIVFVVDSGLAKLPYFDPRTGLQRLIVGPVSQASCRQRTGRCGRIQPGKCFRLFTEDYYIKSMQAHTPPEILRTNLTGFILTLKALGVDNVLAFDLIDVPSVEAIGHGLESLYALGAIDDQTRLTSLGSGLAAFPTEPAISKLLLESVEVGCSWEVAGVAAALQVRDLLLRPHSRRPQQLLDYDTTVAEYADPSGDHVTYANLLTQVENLNLDEEECKAKFVNYVAMKRTLEIRNQLVRLLRRFGRVQALGPAVTEEQRSRSIRRCVTAGFFDQIAKLGNDGQYYTLRHHILVTPSSSSIYSAHAKVSSEYLVYGETMDGARGGIEIRQVSAVEAKWLREIAPHYWQ